MIDNNTFALERGMVGAALCHVDEVITLRESGVTPEDITLPSARFILNVLNDLESQGLLETAQPITSLVLREADRREFKLTHQDLSEFSESAPLPGPPLQRMIKAWHKARDSWKLVQELEQLIVAARAGHISREDLGLAFGEYHE